MSHLFKFEGHGVYSPDGHTDVNPADVERVNRETEEIELAYWATIPERFAPAYFETPAEQEKQRSWTSSFDVDCTGGTVSTWNGAVIGRIVSAHVYSHNFGGRMVSMRIKGTNGAMYHGRASWDNGTLIRLRKAK